MTDLINFIDKFNWQTIIGMFVVGWYFTKDIRNTLVALENDVKQQGKRTDKLYEMFVDLLKDRK